MTDGGIAGPEDIGHGAGEQVHDIELGAVEDPESRQERDIPEDQSERAREAAEGAGDPFSLPHGDGHAADLGARRDELDSQQGWESHAEEAPEGEDPALIEADVLHPLAE